MNILARFQYESYKIISPKLKSERKNNTLRDLRLYSILNYVQALTWTSSVGVEYKTIEFWLD